MLRLLSDEDLPFALIRALKRSQADVDVVRVQEVGLRSQPDQVVLEWAAQNGRILISRDRKTLVQEAYDRIWSNRAMPGVLMLRNRLSLGKAVEDILVIAICCAPEEMQDRVIYLPL
jgi:predicted nuclease of predicted toxin-antitoxin system